jgi:1,2-diacylglycerol 3-alpha-glucosyltransferase
MVIGQFNDAYPPIMDGVANVVKNYACWLNRKYATCYVVTPAVPQYVEPDTYVLNYKSIPIPQRKPFRLGIPLFDFEFKKRLAKISFDIVHAHCPFVSGKLALKIARQQKIPSVASFHAKYYEDFEAYFKIEALARKLLNQVIKIYHQFDVVWAVNQSAADALYDYGFKKQIEVVHNGTDFLPLENVQQALDSINQKFRLPPHQPVFLFVGQHIWQKNIATIIQSLSLLKQKNIAFKMIFVGTGPAEAGMKKMVRENNLQAEVLFLGLILDRTYLRKIFQRADLFLFPSLYDNAPIVVQEAAAADCPSVLIAGSSAAENIKHNVNGFLSQNAPSDFANTIAEILDNPQQLKKVAIQAKKTVCKQWENLVDEVFLRYQSIIKHYR